MSQPPTRPTMLRSLAERAALHPRMEAAVAGAVISAVRNTLPGVIEALLAEQADHQFGTLRLYRRKLPDEMRQQRDQRARALLVGGMSADLVALEVGCSRAHAYRLQAALRRQSQTLP